MSRQRRDRARQSVVSLVLAFHPDCVSTLIRLLLDCTTEQIKDIEQTAPTIEVFAIEKPACTLSTPMTSPHCRSETWLPSLYQTNLCGSVSSGLAKRIVTLPSGVSYASVPARDISSRDHEIIIRDENIGLEHRGEVNHIERPTPPNCVPDHARVDVEVVAQHVSQGLDVRQRNFGDEVDTLGGARNAVHRTGERSRDQVADAEIVEYPREQCDDLKWLGEHQ